MGSLGLEPRMGIRMFLSRRRNFVKAAVRAILVVAALSLPVLETGCESTPIRAIRGARHYAAGTEALNRSDDDLAIEELEQAAELVPQASEVQNHLGLAYWSDGRPQDARIAFEKAVELDCDNDVARANLERLMRSDNSDDVVVEARVEEEKREEDHGE